MSTLQIDSNFYSPVQIYGTPRSHNPKLNQLIQKAFINRKAQSQVIPNAHYWTEKTFGLDQSQQFLSLTEATRTSALSSLNKQLLGNIHYIEKLGFTYCTSLSLTSQNIEEKMIYAKIGFDEAKHFQLINSFINFELPQDYLKHPMLLLISQCLEQRASRSALIFLVQVFLEGFGQRHYRKLRDETTNLSLKAVFNEILADEAYHSGSGRVLIEASPLSESDRLFLTPILLKLIRILSLSDSISTLSTLIQFEPKLDLLALMEEMQVQLKNHSTLQELYRIIKEADPLLVSDLVIAKAFEPLSNEEIFFILKSNQ